MGQYGSLGYAVDHGWGYKQILGHYYSNTSEGFRADAQIDVHLVGQDNRAFPARSLGEIVVVEVGDKISIGLVTLSVQEMALGDIVMMQKSR